MRAITPEDAPIVIDADGVELRVRDEDGLSVGFVRLPAGADLRAATKGLPDDLRGLLADRGVPAGARAPHLRSRRLRGEFSCT
jgi:hypothetical protein